MGRLGAWWGSLSRRGKIVAVVVAVVVLAALAAAGAKPQSTSGTTATIGTSSQVPTASPAPAVAAPTAGATSIASADAHALTVANVTQSVMDNKGLEPLATFDGLNVTIPAADEVDVEAHPTSVLDEHTFLLETGSDALVAAKAVLGWYPSVLMVRMTLDADFTDQYGHTSTSPGAWIDITAGTAAKFDYPGMAHLDATQVFCDADGYYVSPAIWKNVGTSDRGCMTAPMK